MPADDELALKEAGIRHDEVRAELARARKEETEARKKFNWTVGVPVIAAIIGLIGVVITGIIGWSGDRANARDAQVQAAQARADAAEEAAREARRTAEVEFLKAILAMEDRAAGRMAFDWLVDAGYLVGANGSVLALKDQGRYPTPEP